MNPMSTEMYGEPGNANSLLLIVAWFGALMLISWVAGFLRLSYRTSVLLWALLNFAPLVWLASLPHAQILPLLGLLAAALFSFFLGKSVFEKRESNRRAREDSAPRDREEPDPPRQ